MKKNLIALFAVLTLQLSAFGQNFTFESVDCNTFLYVGESLSTNYYAEQVRNRVRVSNVYSGDVLMSTRDYSDISIDGAVPVSAAAAVVSLNKFLNCQTFQAAANTTILDAFGQTRVSQPFTVFDSKLYAGKAPLIWDEVINGTATSTFSDRRSSVIMATDSTNEYIIRQSKMRHSYQPGKSMRITWTGVMPLDSNVTKRQGFYNSGTVGSYADSLDGVWLEVTDAHPDSVYWCLANTGSVQRVARPDWNIDPMYGTGPSGDSLVTDSANIYRVTFGWLGYSTVRGSVIIDGKVIDCHVFTTANKSTVPYMSSPNHSIRGEIRQTGAGSGSMVMTCSAVESEGGLERNGVLRTVSTNGTPITLTTEDSTYTAIAIRLKDDHRDASIVLDDIRVLLGTASSEVEMKVLLNPTITGSVSWVDVPNCAIQVFKGSSTNFALGGTPIGGDYVVSAGPSGGGSGSGGKGLQNAIRLGVDIDGGKDIIVIGLKPIIGSSSVSAEAQLSWRLY